MLYKTLVLPLIDYGDTLYHAASADLVNQLQIIQNKFARIILKVNPRESSVLIHNELRLMKLENRRNLHFATLVFNTMEEMVLQYLSDKFQLIPEDRGRLTRSTTRGDLMIPHTNLVRTDNAFSVRGALFWNSFSFELRNAESVEVFKKLYIEIIGFV